VPAAAAAARHDDPAPIGVDGEQEVAMYTILIGRSEDVQTVNSITK